MPSAMLCWLQKSTKSRPRVKQKSCKSYPKVGQQPAKSQPKDGRRVGPKSSQSRLEVCQKLAQSWTRVGPCRPKVGRKSAQVHSKFSPELPKSIQNCPKVGGSKSWRKAQPRPRRIQEILSPANHWCSYITVRSKR